ncbi:hypothetical protein Ae505Ps2_2936c [Pseudonocardia sp. Ae505_Ps2]|nr:hypothetical protein Ae505Ps2_2936c [Pseudonocardia sp. Ae505_Ps2]
MGTGAAAAGTTRANVAERIPGGFDACVPTRPPSLPPAAGSAQDGAVTRSPAIPR